MKSEGEKIRFVTSPSRDRKYAIVAFSQFIADTLDQISPDVLSVLIKALVELCYE
jgi:hypothetical protein